MFYYAAFVEQARKSEGTCTFKYRPLIRCQIWVHDFSLIDVKKKKSWGADATMVQKKLSLTDWRECMMSGKTGISNLQQKLMHVQKWESGDKSAEDSQHLIHTCGILTDGKICGAFLLLEQQTLYPPILMKC